MQYPSSATKSSWLLLVVIAACTGSLFLVADALHEHHHGRPNIAGATCVPHERDALLAFKEGVVGDPAGRLASWRTGEDCFRHWRGVRCSNLTGHVLKLHLRNTDGGEAAMSGKELYLQGNHFTGTLPNWLGQLTSLVILDLSMNNITGPLPGIFGKFTDLRDLNLAGNQLTGHLPSQISMLSNLTRLDLSNNILDGLITDEHFVGLKGLEYIDLSHNRLKIVLGSPPFRLKKHILQTARWVLCFLHGFSGRWIFLTLILQAQISGGLPTNWEIMSVEQLYLSSNQFTGEIPSLPRNIITLDISSNSLTDLANNHFEGDLPECAEMENLDILMLSNNSFSGKFPSFLQRCFFLSFLDLAWNEFSGTLPMWIGNCTSLRFLRLNNNMFHGHIPGSITGLRDLRHLNLAENRLSGPIPSGGQLETLYTYNPLMYSGNNGLCGFPLQRSCPGNSTSKDGDLSNEKHGDQQIPELHSDDQMFFLFGCGVGFVVGSWVVFFSLLFVKTWRIAYFRLFDSVYDKIVAYNAIFQLIWNLEELCLSSSRVANTLATGEVISMKYSIVTLVLRLQESGKRRFYF
uniref:non-specific serine/threonine protein kinase n=1 Tax=Oryza rufipogon TaxID=4529 RepID=A0A0E0R9T2_ORYRU